MTEQQLQLLGFERIDETGGPPEDHFYYYVLESPMAFISSADNESVAGEWYIEFFNNEDEIRIFDFKNAETLIQILSECKYTPNIKTNLK